MTCKDCIHHKSCFNMAFRCGYKVEALDGAETCEDFKNKADFVEVVRCVECGFRDDNLITTSQNIDCYMCKRHHSLVLLTDFCSYGTRK